MSIRSLFYRWRYSPIIKSMTCEMERLRTASFAKVVARNEAESLGDKKLARILTNELKAEAHIFYQMQRKISSICTIHSIKDPFAI